MYLRIHPANPEPRKIKEVVACLKAGGIIIYPTDTVYGIGCDINSTKAVERLYKLKNLTAKTAQFSFLCKDFSQLSLYAKSIDTPIFKQMKRCLPGPFTFILEASKAVPKVLQTKRNTIGLRITSNNISMALLEELGNPMISTSLPAKQDVEEYTDPEIFYYLFEHDVNMVIDGGIGGMVPSTIVAYNNGNPELIREGAGNTSLLFS